MNLACRDYQEKRDFLRLRVEIPAEVILDQQPVAGGICHNISGGGMLISLAQAVPLGTQMQVTVRSSYGHSPLLKAITQVQRVENPPSEGQACQLALKIITVLE